MGGVGPGFQLPVNGLQPGLPVPGIVQTVGSAAEGLSWSSLGSRREASGWNYAVSLVVQSTLVFPFQGF